MHFKVSPDSVATKKALPSAKTKRTPVTTDTTAHPPPCASSQYSLSKRSYKRLLRKNMVPFFRNALQSKKRLYLFGSAMRGYAT